MSKSELDEVRPRDVSSAVHRDTYSTIGVFKRYYVWLGFIHILLGSIFVISFSSRGIDGKGEQHRMNIVATNVVNKNTLSKNYCNVLFWYNSFYTGSIFFKSKLGKMPYGVLCKVYLDVRE